MVTGGKFVGRTLSRVGLVAVQGVWQAMSCPCLALIIQLQVQEHSRCHGDDHQCRERYGHRLDEIEIWSLNCFDGEDDNVSDRRGEEVHHAVAVNNVANARRGMRLELA